MKQPHLTKHINENYDGNKAAFGRDYDMKPTDVSKLFRAKKLYRVVDDELLLVTKKKVK